MPSSSACLPVLSAGSATGARRLFALAVHVHCAHSQLLHAFCAIGMKKKNKASFLLLSYSLVIWAPDEFLLSNWDQILQGCRNTYFVFSFFCFSIFIFRLCRGFFPSMFICLGETGDLCDRKEWKIEKFLASRRPFLIHLISSLLLSV